MTLSQVYLVPKSMLWIIKAGLIMTIGAVRLEVLSALVLEVRWDLVVIIGSGDCSHLPDVSVGPREMALPASPLWLGYIDYDRFASALRRGLSSP